MRAVKEGNAARKRRAAGANKTSYEQMYVAFRDACVVCDEPIRREPGVRSAFAKCGCEGVNWAKNTSSIITEEWDKR